MQDILAGKTESQQPSKPASQAAAQPQGENKIKATHYLQESTLFRLEQALLGIRMSSGRRDINRYDVVEQALQMALSDYEQRGPESELTKRLQ
jgi:hypothetical protein